jgi:hypothetical protein
MGFNEQIFQLHLEKEAEPFLRLDQRGGNAQSDSDLGLNYFIFNDVNVL